MAKERKRTVNTLPEGQIHPHLKWEGTPLWKAIEKGVADLVENQDLVENEHREYIVVHLQGHRAQEGNSSRATESQQTLGVVKSRYRNLSRVGVGVGVMELGFSISTITE